MVIAPSGPRTAKVHEGTTEELHASPRQVLSTENSNAALTDELDALIRVNKEKLAQLQDAAPSICEPLHIVEQKATVGDTEGDDVDSEVDLPLLSAGLQRMRPRSLPAPAGIDQGEGHSGAYI